MYGTPVIKIAVLLFFHQKSEPRVFYVNIVLCDLSIVIIILTKNFKILGVLKCFIIDLPGQ